MTNIRQFFNRAFTNNSLGFIVLVSLVVLLPVLFIPSPFLSSVFVKSLLVTLGTAVLVIATVVRAIKIGEIAFSRSPVVWGLLGVIFASVMSAVLSDSVRSSVFGNGPEVTILTNIILFAFLCYLSILSFSNPSENTKRFFSVYAAFGAVAFVIAILQVLFVLFGTNILSFLSQWQFMTYVANTIGKTTEFGIFYGIVLLLSVVALETLKLNRLYRTALYILSVCSLFFLVLVNFSPINYVLLSVLWLLFFYLTFVLFRRQNTLQLTQEGDTAVASTVRTTRKLALKTLIVAVFVTFLALPIGTRFSDSVAVRLGVGNFEVRPSWDATYEIFRNTISSHSFFGAGLNRFGTQWQLHHPVEVLRTPFWNANFETGIGLLPTLFVETGLVGVFLWALLLLAVLYVSVRALFTRSSDPVAQFFILAGSMITLFLWAMMSVYSVGIVIVALTFIFTGILVASTTTVGVGSVGAVTWQTRSKANIVAVVLGAVLILLSLWTVYNSGSKAFAAYYFQKGDYLVSNNIDLAMGEKYIERAIRFSKNDVFYRAITNINILKINTLLSQAYGRESVTDEEKNAFASALDAAQKAAQSAVLIDPGNYQNIALLGKLYSTIIPVGIDGAYEAAIKQFDQALLLSPRNPEIVLEIARAHVAKDDNEKAKESISRALTLKPDYIDAIFLLAQIDVTSGNLQAAIRSVEQIVAITPTDPLTHFRLGLLYYDAKNYKKAQEAFQNSISLVPVYANARYFLGLSLYQLGKRADAIAQFEEIDRTNPGVAEIGDILRNLRAGKDPLAGSDATDIEDREELPVDEE